MNTSHSSACPYCPQLLRPAGEGVQSCPKCKHTLVPASDPLTKTFEAWMPADLGRFQVTVAVGGGGMGRIFRGQDKLTNEAVAVKFPAGKQDWNQNAYHRFEREIAILQTLNHPNIVHYLAAGTEAGRSYYVMEWVEGEDIGKVLAHCRTQKKSLPFEYVHKCFQQLCSALQTLHDRGIIHRDVKPANIIVTADGTIKLIDLGIAKLQGVQTTAATRMTGALGTDAYLAPEQLLNPQMVDHRADIFATGQVTYEMLTGFLPKGNVRKPSEINPTVPEWFETLLMKMMEHEPNKRPSRIGDLVDMWPKPTPRQTLTSSSLAGQPTSTQQMETQWYCAIGQKSVGPFSFKQLLEMVVTGELRPTSRVWHEGAEKWIPASSVPGLFIEATEKQRPDSADAPWVIAVKDRTSKQTRESSKLKSLFPPVAPSIYAIYVGWFLTVLPCYIIEKEVFKSSYSMTATLIEGIIGSTSGALVSWWSSRKKQRHFQGLDANTARAAINAKLAAAKTEPEREAARKEAKDLSESLESVSWETVPVSKRVKLIVRWVGFVAAWILFSVGLFAWTMRTHYKATHYYQQLDKYVNQARMCRDKEKALQYYTEAIALFKKEGRGLDTDIPAVIYFERGRIYHQKDMYENAIQDYDYAIKYNGTQALYYGFRGLAYDEMKFYDKAISDYGEAIRLDNTQAAHYLARGVVYCLKQDWDTAIADFNQAIKLDNKCAEAYRYRHIVHKAKGNLAQANADYQQAIAIKPELVKSVKTKQ